MRPPAFDRPGRFFRGNLHCHSTRSDGFAEPEQVVDSYRAAGYDFLVLSDHFEAEWGWSITDTRPLSGDGFTTILGAELSSGPWDEPNAYWVVSAGLPPDFPAPNDGEPHDHAIRRAAEAGAFNVLLHPGINNFVAFDRLALDHLHAVETFNHHSAVMWPDAAEGRYALEALLERGARLNITAADDSHWQIPGDRFGAWVAVKAEEQSPEALVAALHAGAYYSTQGPRVDDVRVEDGHVHVECSPVRSVVLTGTDWMRNQVKVSERPRDHARLPLSELGSPYWRLTLTDEHGKRAWTNPVWLEA